MTFASFLPLVPLLCLLKLFLSSCRALSLSLCVCLYRSSLVCHSINSSFIISSACLAELKKSKILCDGVQRLQRGLLLIPPRYAKPVAINDVGAIVKLPWIYFLVDPL
eukprot:m.55854 g.55854  ORF g.55854 m.55854 type:complete len:108 (+) comp12975_c0_seq2:1-324(+)